MKPTLSKDASAHELAGAVQKLAETVGDLSTRLKAVEEARASERARPADGTWKIGPRVRDGLVLVLDPSGETVEVPMSVVRPLSRGRSLDLRMEPAGDEVRFIDDHGVVVARVPRGLMVVLPRLLEGWAQRAAESHSRSRVGYATKANAASEPARRLGSPTRPLMAKTGTSSPDESRENSPKATGGGD